MYHLFGRYPGVEQDSSGGVALVDGTRKHHSFVIKTLHHFLDVAAAQRDDRRTYFKDFQALTVAVVGAGGEIGPP